MILIDSNVPMYLVGADDALRAAAQAAVRRAHASGLTLVTDAEVYQEILHRYVAIRRRSAIDPCVAFLDRIVARVYPVDRSTVGLAMQVLRSVEGISARDAVHVAVARRHGIARILSFDRGFDAVASLTRLA